VEHFLIQCSKYAKARHKLRASIQYINIKFDWLTLKLNDTKAMPYILKFIHQTVKTIIKNEKISRGTTKPCRW